jgi:hypothetical protein
VQPLQPHYWACQACNAETPAGAKRRKEQLRLQPSIVPDACTEPEQHEAAVVDWGKLANMLVSLPAGFGMQLSVLRCSVRFAQRIRGYIHALEPDTAPPLLRGPLMQWDPEVRTGLLRTAAYCNATSATC